MSTPTNEVPAWTIDEDQIETVVLRPDISHEDSQNLYKTWAKAGTYEEVLGDPHKYTGLVELIDCVEEFVTDRNSLILDVGAGTGLNGKLLHESGYSKLHALEPVSGFTKALDSKDVYTEIHTEFIGSVSLEDDTYDAIVSTGAFGPGAIPPSAIPEMIRLVKPGGYIVISMRREFTWTVPQYKDILEPLWDQLAEEKKWKLIKRKVYPNHFCNRDGLVVVYQVC